MRLIVATASGIDNAATFRRFCSKDAVARCNTVECSAAVVTRSLRVGYRNILLNNIVLMSTSIDDDSLGIPTLLLLPYSPCHELQPSSSTEAWTLTEPSTYCCLPGLAQNRCNTTWSACLPCIFCLLFCLHSQLCPKLRRGRQVSLIWVHVCIFALMS